ncbi:MAG: collagen-binding domain-containing protein, partial [Spirosomataceae bacterium]
MKNFTIKQFFLSISVLFTNFSMLYSVFLRYLSSFKNRAKKKEIAFFMVIVSIFFPTLVNGQDNPLAPAKGFNVISNSGGASLNQGDIDGGLATLGGLTLRGAFTMSGHTAGSYVVSGDVNSTSLIVEGPVSYTSGSGMNVNSQGYIKLKDMSTSKYWPSTSPTRVTVSTASSQDANPRIEMSATQSLASINQDAFDFGGAFASFYNSSDTYKNCTSNIGVSTTSISSYTFNLTSGRSNFFKVNGSNLDDFNEIKFNIVPSATNPAIITVDLQGASTFNWPVPNFPGVPNAAGQYILFNFVNGASGATINLNGGSTIVGTVFAPYFNVNKVGSGNIEGQVICNAYTHEAGEVHYQVFNTTVNCSAHSSVTCDCAGNLLINPSFELNDDRAGYDSYYRTKGWSWTGAPAISAFYTNTGYSVCDSYNAFLYGGSGAAWVWQQVNGVSVGTSYSLSAYGGTHEPLYYDHRIRLVFYNSAGTALLTKEVQVDWDVDLVTSGPALKEYSLSGTAPAGTSYLRVEGYSTGDYLKLDNFCLTVDNSCNNVTSGGSIGSNQTLCKNSGATDPAALTNVTSPSGGNTGVGLEYQWYSSTILSNGACSTNMTGSIYSAISGATTATYDPGAISQTTCYIRASRRVNCSDYVGLSNAVKVVVKNNCTVTACANNLVQNGGFETDNGAVNSTTNTKFPVSFMSSPASYITQTNGVNTTSYLGTQPQYWTIGTDVNDYLNKNGAYYIDASSTGNAYSGDRFIWGRVNQCLVFSLPNQSLLPVSEGKKYRICAYVAAFNPTSSVQGDAKFVFETYFRNANNGGAGLLDEQYNWKSATADADGKWETLGWQQVCQDVTAPAGATALGFQITASDNEGDGLAIDDVCVTELPGTTPPTITNINKCGAGVSTITLGGCSGGTINWYDSMSNKTAFITGASYTTPSLTVSKTYYVSCTVSGSESMKVPVSVIVNGAVTGVSATPSATTTCGTAVSINGAGAMTNPNLVTNGSFTDGNVGFGTDYGFQNWTNGGYGVTTDASTYYTWASACKDRTASGTGNIFVADGALDAAAAVWYQTIPVKANTTYRLSTYASSIGSSSPAVLAFYVNGVKVGTSTTLSTTTCQWQQITTTWSSGSATSALFEIRNENAVVGGNDFALDDISVTYENPTLTYSWTGPNSFTATTQNVSVTTAGTYTLTVSAPSGCTATASTTIATCPCPTLSNASPSTTIAICAGATIPSLSLTSNLAVSGTMIEWCAFTSAQTNPYTSTATMYCLQPEANVINGTITATNLTGMPTIPGTYYVYACLKPVPTDPSCRPFVSYIVTVTANPVPVSVTGGTVCATGSAQSVPLSATCITGATPTWYSSQTSTTALATATSYSPSVSTTTTYYVGCKLTASPNCETATGSRTAVTATVNPTPSAPTISVASGSSLNVCSGSATTLTASTCTIGSILWSTGATTSSITVSPTSNTTYSATCVASSCPSATSNTLTVTVTNNVTNGGTIAGNQTNCGAFDPVAFTNVTLPSGGNGTVEYVWMKSTTASTFTTANASEWFVIIGSTGATYDAPTVSTTTYYIRCSRTAGCSDYVGESNIVSVTINPSQSVSATGTTKCLGETIQLSATSSTASSYSWSGPGTYTATLQNPIVTGLTAGTYSYTVTVTGTGGCTATANATVIINPIPAAPSVTGATICGSGSVNLSATCSTGQTAQWYSSTSSNTVLTSGSTYSPSVSSTTTYYVGCKDNTTLCETAGANRTAVTATVNPTPTAPTISVASGSSLNVCSGSATTLTASTCTIGSILWSTGATTSSITVSPTSNTTYSATCVASSCPSATSNTLTVTVTNNVTNGGTIAGNQTNCGAFDPVAFTNVTLPSGGNGTVEYVWMKSTTASTFTTANASEWFVIIGSTGATYDAPTVSTTTYYIRCSRTAGCSDYVGESNIVSVTINPSQSVSATGTTKCLGETIQLSATSSTASSYSWSGPGTYTATLQNPIVTGLTAGTYSYTVTVTGTGGCTATANATVIINPIPAAPSVTGATICGSGSVNLSATCSTGQTAQWYSSTSSNTVLTSGSTYSPSVSSTTTYYVGCKDNT